MPRADFHTSSALISSLPERSASMRQATLVLATSGPTLATLAGQRTCAGDVVLEVWELVDCEAGHIRHESDDISRAGATIAWYVHSNILISLPWPARLRITNTFLPIASAIVSRRLASASDNRTFPPS